MSNGVFDLLASRELRQGTSGEGCIVHRRVLLLLGIALDGTEFWVKQHFARRFVALKFRPDDLAQDS
jgi:hypothetical protein